MVRHARGGYLERADFVSSGKEADVLRDRASLPAPVQIMSRVQLGEALSEADTRRVVAFFESLTGEIPANILEAPVLPAAGFQPAAASPSSLEPK